MDCPLAMSPHSHTTCFSAFYALTAPKRLVISTAFSDLLKELSSACIFQDRPGYSSCIKAGLNTSCRIRYFAAVRQVWPSNSTIPTTALCCYALSDLSMHVQHEPPKSRHAPLLDTTHCLLEAHPDRARAKGHHVNTMHCWPGSHGLLLHVTHTHTLTHNQCNNTGTQLSSGT